jgi:hypothetical protein
MLEGCGEIRNGSPTPARIAVPSARCAVPREVQGAGREMRGAVDCLAEFVGLKRVRRERDVRAGNGDGRSRTKDASARLRASR